MWEGQACCLLPRGPFLTSSQSQGQPCSSAFFPVSPSLFQCPSAPPTPGASLLVLLPFSMPGTSCPDAELKPDSWFCGRGLGNTSIPIYMHRLLVFSVSQGGPYPTSQGRGERRPRVGSPPPMAALWWSWLPSWGRESENLGDIKPGTMGKGRLAVESPADGRLDRKFSTCGS